jgi:DNA-binding NtrC family response regulator
MDSAHLPEVIIISGHGTIEAAVRATKLGAYDFLEKPLSLDRTLLVLRTPSTPASCARTTRSSSASSASTPRSPATPSP